jgi:hypothetical protein
VLTKSKFYGIRYPLFGLKQLPDSYLVSGSSIYLQKSSAWYCIDKVTPNKDLLNRYLSVKSPDFSFDATCLNISQLISKRLKWGIDSNFKIYDLSKKQKFLARNVKILKHSENVIWVDTVSYPFKVKSFLISPSELLNQYITIVYVDNIWVLHRFTSFSEPVTEIVL